MEDEKKSKFPFVVVVAGILIGLLISFISAVGIHHTSDKTFCASCHTMQPMVDAWANDVHGGAGKHGMEVKCVDCHLPHDSTMNYLLTKMQTGLHDIYAQNFYDLSKINWEEKRKEREHLVYDSACLACHTNLEKATMSNLKAFKGHREYFSGRTDRKCVSCHENVGHKDLGTHLKKLEVQSSSK